MRALLPTSNLRLFFFLFLPLFPIPIPKPAAKNKNKKNGEKGGEKALATLHTASLNYFNRSP